MTNVQEQPFERTHGERVSINGKFFNLVGGKVHRRRISDWPRPVPSTGQQQSDNRYLRNALSIGAIKNAFGPTVIGPWHRIDPITLEDYGEHLSHGHIHWLRDSSCETRFGGKIMLPLRQQSVVAGITAKTLAGTLVQHAHLGGTGTAIQYNDRPAVYFQGTSVGGLYIWSAEADTGATNKAISALRWSGATWNLAGAIVPGTGNLVHGYDMAVNKNRLYWLGTDNRGTSTLLRYSTTGNTWSTAAATGLGAAALAGSRVLDGGATLYCFIQTAGTARLYYSTDDGANFTAGASVSGQLRSVAKWRVSADEEWIVALTDNALYRYDATGDAFVRLLGLPAPGRAMVEWGGRLHVAMDSQFAWRLWPDGRIDSISPGGVEGMPSDKRTGAVSGGVCVVTLGTLGPVFAWGSSVGTVNALQFTGDGWHYLFSVTPTGGAAYAPRMVEIDTATGDLLYLAVSLVGGAEQDNPAGARLTTFETDPDSLGGNAAFAESGSATWPEIIFGPMALNTTAWSWFFKTEDVDTTETLTATYSADGAAAASTYEENLTGLIEDDDESLTFGASGEGLAFRSLAGAVALARASGDANDHLSPKITTQELAFLKTPPVRWLYIVPVILQHEDSPDGLEASLSDIDTIEAAQTKIVFGFAQQSKRVLPIPESEGAMMIQRSDALERAIREATHTFYLAEV